MDVIVNHSDGIRGVKLSTGEFLDIKGAIFKICSIGQMPLKIQLELANVDQVKEFLAQTPAENLSKPALAEPAKLVEEPKPTAVKEPDPTPAVDPNFGQPVADIPADLNESSEADAT